MMKAAGNLLFLLLIVFLSATFSSFIRPPRACSCDVVTGFWNYVVHPLALDGGCSGWTKTSSFGMRTHPITGLRKLHDGVDLAKSGGCTINSVGKGRVTFSSWDKFGGGHVVRVDHQNNFETAYLHGSGKYFVSVGDQVSRYSELMHMGSSSNSTGTHLHFSLAKNGKATNPEQEFYFGDLSPSGALFKSTKRY